MDINDGAGLPGYMDEVSLVNPFFTFVFFFCMYFFKLGPIMHGSV